MTLQNLRYIVEVAECRSFSAAAQELFMTQSALSAAVRETEEELGIHIFKRTNRGVSLTADGEDCLKHCKEIVERSDYLAARYANRQSIRTSFSVSMQHLPFAVRAFNELLETLTPDHYDVAVRETETSAVLRDISTDKSEIGVIAVTGEQLRLLKKALFINDLCFQERARLNTYVFLRRRHPLAERPAISLKELADYPFVTYDQEKAPTYYSEESLFFETLRRIVHVSDRATKMAVLRSTDAFSIGTDLTNFNQDFYFRHRAAEMAAVPFADQPEPVLVGTLTKNGHAMTPLGERYIALLQTHIQHLQVPLGREDESGPA